MNAFIYLLPHSALAGASLLESAGGFHYLFSFLDLILTVLPRDR